MEAKGLRVNTKKTKVMISHPNACLVYKVRNILAESAQKVLKAIQSDVHLANR